MNVKDYLWYPYLEYQKQCKKEGKEDTITEWLIITGKIPPPPKKVIGDSTEEVKVTPKKAIFVIFDPENAILPPRGVKNDRNGGKKSKFQKIPLYPPRHF